MVDKNEFARKAIGLIKTVVVNHNGSVKDIITQRESNNQIEFSLSAFTDDESVIEFMKTYDLTNPQKIIKFFVDVHFATIESIFDNLGEIEQDIIEVNGLASIKDAEIKYEQKKYQDAENDLIHGFSVLNLAITKCVTRIRNIDNLKGLEFAIKAVFGNRKRSETATTLARMSVNGFFEIIKLNTIMYSELKAFVDNPPDNVLYSKCNELMKYLLSGDTCRLMHSFDKNKDGFWLNLPDKIKEIQNENAELRAFFDTIDDNDIESYENIII